ncbi:MAG: trypsin-like peptidase domain-containing protein [Chloroflexi bacterium]|nr:trypsin-like peptidase domain-containing protein [Chloroflexota bacterium]
MTRGAAVFVLVAALLGGLTGGLVGAAVVANLVPLPSSATTSGLFADDIAAAAAAVSPAVVTVVVSRQGVDAWGSGLVVDKEKGTIVTNSHVVEIAGATPAAGDLTILLADGRTLGATILGSDAKTDVAVLRASGPLPAQAELASAQATVGSRVIAIGTPGTQLATQALANTVTVGIVSGTGRRVPRADDRNVVLSDLIQTDASIGDGMSGGPLVLVSSKQVIGVSTSFIRGQMDLGFAVSAATVKRVLAEILAKGTP